MSQHGVLFGPGTLVSPGEYRNQHSGQVRWFDGATPLPGGPNSGSWKQVSDHQHVEIEAHNHLVGGEEATRPVRFGAGTVVPAGEYRNVRSGAVRWFDGATVLPGGPNSGSWQQVSDHFHSEKHAPRPATA